MTSLLQEYFDQCRPLHRLHFERLSALGVSLATLARAGGARAARIATDAEGMWQPDPDGRAALVVPVIGHDALGLSEVVDLIALVPAEPMRWWWRAGEAFALGLDQLAALRPLPVHRTPLDWLSAGGVGLVILDWDAPPRRWIPVIEAVGLVAPPDLQTRLEAAAIRGAPRPNFMDADYALAC